MIRYPFLVPLGRGDFTLLSGDFRGFFRTRRNCRTRLPIQIVTVGRSGRVYNGLAQGTLCPDVIESVSFKGPSATIKTHHNVGGLPPNMRLKLVEPLREPFKDEVRGLGAGVARAALRGAVHRAVGDQFTCLFVR